MWRWLRWIRQSEFAKEHGIPNAFEDYREMLKMKDIDVVTIAIPNYVHRQATVDAAKAGKHVICEKPLCVTLEEADEMIDTCKKQGVLLMYAEELLFAPKYVRAKTLIDEGAIGEPFLAKQSEEHPGPHMPWFWDVNLSGGGVMLDMGCHSIEYTRWVLGKPKVKSVTAFMGTYVHQDKTKGEDHSYAIIEYEGNKIAMIENSWAKGGGVDDRCEIYGKKGHTRVPTFCAAVPCSPIPRKVTAMRSKKPGRQKVTPSPCSKKPGTTAFRKKCSILSIVCSVK